MSGSQEFVLVFMILSWGGPIGLGIFLAGLGVYYWGRGSYKKSTKDENS